MCDLHTSTGSKSSNQLLSFTTNQKRYADTSTLYKEAWFLVRALALLLSSSDKKLLATDEGSNCLVPKPVLHQKLDKQFSSELYHGAVNIRCGDGSHFNRHGRQPSARTITNQVTKKTAWLRRSSERDSRRWPNPQKAQSRRGQQIHPESPHGSVVSH